MVCDFSILSWTMPLGSAGPWGVPRGSSTHAQAHSGPTAVFLACGCLTKMAAKASRSLCLLAFLLFEAARALQAGPGGGGFPAQHHAGGQYGSGQQQQPQDQQQVRGDGVVL